MNTRTVSLAELRALHAASSPMPSRPELPIDDQVPSTPAVEELGTAGRVGVRGATGGAGASTIALALAEALGAGRLVEFASPDVSGLVGASTAELGDTEGWSIGVRDRLRLERRILPDARVLDAVVGGWEVFDLGPATAPPGLAATVVVAPCSVPGVRRAEALLEQPDPRIAVVITGVPGRRLPRQLRGVVGPRLRSAVLEGRVFLVPECPVLRIGGLTPGPLPRRLSVAVESLATWLEDLS